MSEKVYTKKWRLVDTVLSGRIIETSVNNLPVLSTLFKEFEKGQQYVRTDMNMKDFDQSCKSLYEDSISGTFDSQFYQHLEWKVKVITLWLLKIASDDHDNDRLV